MKRNALFGFSVRSAGLGTGSFAAAAARAPYPIVRPLPEWTTSWFFAVHSPAGTFHCAAAALTSMVRAVAPATRNVS